jgi:predicted chitinase
MRAREIIVETDLEEGWKEKASAAALGTALALGGAGLTSMYKHRNDQVTPQPNQPAQQYKATPKQSPKDFLIQVAQDAGIEGAELVQLVSQSAHETMNFTRMAEYGTQEYFLKKYDLSTKTGKRKAKILGNTQPGDGVTYRGRGYLHLTGRDNYTRAGRAIGVDLVNRPDLVETDPVVNAKASLWYWNNRVKPKVNDFTDVRQVTKKINPGMKGIKNRLRQFKAHSDLGK